MRLTRVERERIIDSRLKIQSVAASLSQVDPEKIPEFDQIQGCLNGVEKNLVKALQRPDTESELF